MLNDYYRLLSNLPRESVPPHLMEKILIRIRHETARRARIRLVVASVILAFAMAAIMPTWNVLASAATESGFTSFLSLLVSDTREVCSAWPSFTLSLLETLPTMGLMLVFLLGFILIEALASALKNTRALLYPHASTA